MTDPSPPTDPRVYFASERTLLAWIRTGISILGVGFLVAKFGLFLRLMGHQGWMIGGQHGSTLFGVAFVVAGSMAIAVAGWQHRRFMQGLTADQLPHNYSLTSSLLLAGLLAVMGLVLAGYLAATSQITTPMKTLAMISLSAGESGQTRLPLSDGRGSSIDVGAITLMPTPLGVAITAWTARVAVGCYVARLLIDAARPHDDRWQQRARLVWTLGVVSFLMHVAAAFHYYHAWSHAAAWEHTREQTLGKTGWDSGAGLSCNYAFTLVWLIDAAAWWFDVRWPRRQWAYFTLQGFYAFMIINATAVFGPPGWFAVAALVLVALAVARSFSRGTA